MTVLGMQDHATDRVVPEHERRRLFIQVRIHADKPGSDRLGRLALEKELHDLVGVVEALFGSG